MSETPEPWDLVEHVARALQMSDFPDDEKGERWADSMWGEDDPNDLYQNNYRHEARAAIAAVREWERRQQP